MDRARINRQRGAVLITVVILVMIVFMVAFAKFAMIGAQGNLARQSGIDPILSRIDTAFVNFVAQNRRLPCPADGAIPSGLVNAGLESPLPATGVCNPANQSRGVVPWVTLGLSEADASDLWSGRISYRVDPALVTIAPSRMDMNQCRNLGTGSVGPLGDCLSTCQAAALATCTNTLTFLTGKGLDVWDGKGGAAGWAAREADRTKDTGAAYVIISHGPSGAGAYNKNGVYQPGTVGRLGPGNLPAGVDEMPNLNGKPVAVPSSQATTYRVASAVDALTIAHFDDYLHYPSIRTVADRAKLGPRDP